MKKSYILNLLFAFSLTLTGCIKGGVFSTNTPFDNLSDQEVEIKISDLIDFDGLLLNPTNPLAETSIAFSTITSPRAVTKNIVIKNNSAVTKNLNFGITGSFFKIQLNRCGATLAAGQSCSVLLGVSTTGFPNATYMGTLQVLPVGGEVPLEATVSIVGNILPTNDGSVNELQMTLNNTYQTYTAGSNPYRYINVLNTTNKNVNTINYSISPDFKILLNRCGNSIGAGSVCKILVYYKNYKTNTLPVANNSNLTLSNGVDTRNINLFAATYIATYSAYSPATNPYVNSCEGSTVGTRTITACQRADNLQAVSLSNCTDDSPTITYNSPAGEKAFSITNGTRFDTCSLGSTVVTSSRYECNAGFAIGGALNNECIASSAPFALAGNQSTLSSGSYKMIVNMDSSSTQSSSGNYTIIYLNQ